MNSRRNSLLSEGLDELNALIGMSELKEEIEDHCNAMRGLQVRAARGFPAERPATHLVFAGPPGTGKTTVAKSIAKIYAGLGIIKTDKVKIAGRADFVGKYMGHSTAQARDTLNAALDGVLFIDEAYALVTDTGAGGSKDSFGLEVVAEIVAFMEEYRDRLVVIIAGYRADIDRLLETNEGWSSRFNKHFYFRSYDMDELLQMAESWCQAKMWILSDDAAEFLRSQEESLFAEHLGDKFVIDELGNGRFIRNLMERSLEYSLSHAMKSSLVDEDVTDEAVQTLTKDAVHKAFTALTKKALGGE